jgi:DNA repair ATPase RecN
LEPIYLDIHIHTSENPDRLNENYDIDLLIEKIKAFTNNTEFLISFTDHNTINKVVYLKAKNKTKNILLGVELHIRYDDDKPPYHCHIYFNIDDITGDVIDDLNDKLDDLYPNKVVTNEDVTIPKLETVITEFSAYEFILLPHGGQSHSTFDRSVPDDTTFDSTIERSIYYNQFDGFTARSNKGLERTLEYFKRLGINDFINLVTCTDNYKINDYPMAKAEDAGAFIPTWMLASPTFDGLRLSLSESSRLVYSEEKPISWSECITKVKLQNDNIEIDVDLTPGLNVIIGGSSSGKTLLVDSIYNKIIGDFSESVYTEYGIDNISVINPSRIKPHYINQSYINKVIDKNDSDNTIDDIEIIKSVFPGDVKIRLKVEKGLLELRKDLSELTSAVKILEDESNKLSHIPILSRLITKGIVQENIINKFQPESDTISLINYSEESLNDDNEYLDRIESFLENNPLIEHNPQLIKELKDELQNAYSISILENNIRKIIEDEKQKYDNELKADNQEQQSKKQNFEKLLISTEQYSKALSLFHKILNKISAYSIKCESEVLNSMGHKLFIENDFKLNKVDFLEVINKYLKAGLRIQKFEEIQPENLFEENFSKRNPKVQDYDDFENKVYHEFERLNKKTYRIITSDGKNYEELSAGWKTSVILDIILGYEGDLAPLIIDQPEDNLATNYINKGLIEAIKKIKTKKQIILVSHNATIPMLGDAQNIILCRNEGGKINIKSNRLESKIDGKSVVDYIAEITDGGKSAIKKRVKKYNLKNYRN